MLFPIATAGLLAFIAIYTVLFAPVLKRLGVKNKVLLRSTTVAIIAASTLLAPSFFYSLSSGTSTINLLMIPGLLLSTYAVSRFLRKAMIIKLWLSISVALTVILGGAVIVIVITQILFPTLKLS